MTRSVRVLRRAQQDVEGCYGYIAERSPPGAESWFNRFAETRDRLAIDAERRGLASESDFVDYEIREVLFKTRQGRPIESCSPSSTTRCSFFAFAVRGKMT